MLTITEEMVAAGAEAIMKADKACKDYDELAHVCLGAAIAAMRTQQMQDDLVERVARAIEPHFDSYTPSEQKDLLRIARAAIAAMPATLRASEIRDAMEFAIWSVSGPQDAKYNEHVEEQIEAAWREYMEKPAIAAMPAPTDDPMDYVSPPGKNQKSFTATPDLRETLDLMHKARLSSIHAKTDVARLREALKEAIDVFGGMNDDEINVELLPRLRAALRISTQDGEQKP